MKRSIMMLAVSAVAVLAGCVENPPPAVLEASAGTYAQQIGAESSEVKLGTAILVKLRTGTGVTPPRAASVTITGPSGWNGDAAATFTYPAGAYWVVAPQLEAAPLPGAYTVSAVFDGERLSQTINISDTPGVLESTKITTALEGDLANQSVVTAWSAVPSAIGYYAKIVDGTLGVSASDDSYTLEPKTTLPVGTLNPARAYFAVVVAANFDTVVDNPALPNTLSMSDSIVAVRGVTGQSCFECGKLSRRASSMVFKQLNVPLR